MRQQLPNGVYTPMTDLQNPLVLRTAQHIYLCDVASACEGGVQAKQKSVFTALDF